MGAKGRNGETLEKQLRKLPRTIPQCHLWFLLKIQFNAPITKARIVKAVRGAEAETCPLCRQETETIQHLAKCPVVQDAYARLQRGVRLAAGAGGYANADAPGGDGQGHTGGVYSFLRSSMVNSTDLPKIRQ